jgi:hypothetical protein
MANNIQVIDANGATVVLKTTDNGGVHTPNHIVASLPADPLGANADAAVEGDAAGSINAHLRGINKILDERMPEIGPDVAASAMPVVLATDNPLPTKVSTDNSTTSVLGAAAVFTGTGEDVSKFRTVVVSVYASHASASDGFEVHFSSNGTNWDITKTYSVSATTGAYVAVPVLAQYFRVKYTNGGTLQTSFRLQTILHPTVLFPSIFPAGQEALPVSGSLSLSGALPAGTNNIGDVDVLSLPALPTGTNTIGKVKLTDGTDDATVRDVTGAKALDVSIVDGSGNQITSFGGGTQYTEGDTDASITGTALLWEDASNTLRAASSSKPLPVEVIAGGTSGTEYTEDAAAAADPVGGMMMAVRRDTLSGSEVSADGDNVALKATAKGELHVKHVDTIQLAASTNNIGDVDVLTQPARVATTDSITAKLATDKIQDGLTALTPKFAIISESSSGDNEVVAAVTGPDKKIRVLSYVLMTNAAVNAKWRSASTDKSGLLYCGANGGAVAPFSPVGHFETVAGEALNLNLSGAVAVGGHVTYVEV